VNRPDLRSATPRLTHRSLERGLTVLEIVAGQGELISLADISRRSGLHRSTAHHLLQTLVGLGYLRQDADTRAYEPDSKLFQITARLWTPEQLGAIAQSAIAELARLSGERASLAAYRDGVVTIVAKWDEHGPVHVAQDQSAARPLHASAVGKAIAAFLPPAELNGLLARLHYERYTSHTIVSRPALEQEFHRIRAAGCANDDEEHQEGVRCLAVPVRVRTGAVIASLCAHGPKNRMTRERLSELREPLLALATEVSERLGTGFGAREPGKIA